MRNAVTAAILGIALALAAAGQDGGSNATQPNTTQPNANAQADSGSTSNANSTSNSQATGTANATGGNANASGGNATVGNTSATGGNATVGNTTATGGNGGNGGSANATVNANGSVNNSGNNSSNASSNVNGVTSGSQSSSNSGNNKITINTTNNTSRGFIGASAGPTGVPGPFPGYAPSHGDWEAYRPGSVIPRDDLKTAHDLKGLKRTHMAILGKVDAEGDGVHLVPWWPEQAGYRDDRVLGEIAVIAPANVTPLQVVYSVLGELAEKTGSNRCAARVRPHVKGVTKGFSIGAGGSAARITEPSSDNDAVAFATGGVIGKNVVERQEETEVVVMCLGPGSYELPQPPTSAQVSAPPATPTLPPPAPAPAQQAFIPPPPPPDPCASLPKFTINFAYDMPARGSVEPGRPYRMNARDFWTEGSGSRPVNEWQDRIELMAQWIKKNPKCHLQVRGFASEEADYDYNAGLALRRAWVVYYLLKQYLGDMSPAQLEEQVSFSKQDPIPGAENGPNSRRVTLMAIGPKTGP
ncbi:MAG TPA: hypothetical protein VMT99_00195 [Candidatus Paceibacterota bacterium]|nr:hypothetical protein [Candidatus Paceibacterota bacterium]